MPRLADGEAEREGEPGQKNGCQLRHAARKRLKKWRRKKRSWHGREMKGKGARRARGKKKRKPKRRLEASTEAAEEDALGAEGPRGGKQNRRRIAATRRGATGPREHRRVQVR